MGRDDIATAYIGQLQQAQHGPRAHRVPRPSMRQLASKQALKARDNYVLNMKKRTAEAMQLISAAKQAKLQEQLAQTMDSLQSSATTHRPLTRCAKRSTAALPPPRPNSARHVIGRYADAGHRARGHGYPAAGQAARIQTADGLARCRNAAASESRSTPALRRPRTRGVPTWYSMKPTNRTIRTKASINASRANQHLVSYLWQIYRNTEQEIERFNSSYCKEAVKEPVNFWGLAGFAVAAAYTGSVIPLLIALICEVIYLVVVPNLPVISPACQPPRKGARFIAAE